MVNWRLGEIIGKDSIKRSREKGLWNEFLNEFCVSGYLCAYTLNDCETEPTDYS